MIGETTRTLSPGMKLSDLFRTQTAGKTFLGTDLPAGSFDLKAGIPLLAGTLGGMPTDAPQGNVFMAGLLGPGPGLGDMTGEGGIIQKLGELFGLIDPIDPENDGLPMDEGLPLPDDFKGALPPGSMTETLEASADTYTLPNLLQMIEDARDAGNEDELELLTNDLEMLFPGATMTI